MDPIVLSYHDSLLRKSDVTLLDEPNWLNDKVIGFYFEYLEYEMFKEYADKVCFITPDVTQFIKLYEGAELGVFLEPLSLDKKSIVVLAVNNNPSSENAGGSHWSTLIYVRNTNIIHHYDSFRPNNLSSAKQCFQRITPFLKSATVPVLQDHLDCSQQQNCYDCGVYALWYTEAVCREQFQCDPISISVNSVTAEQITHYRTKIKQLIQDLVIS